MSKSTTIPQSKHTVLATILVLLILITATFSYTVARAHSWPSYCAHSDHYSNGWYTWYEGHVTYSGQHWHHYEHAYLDGGTGEYTNWHTQVNSCPN